MSEIKVMKQRDMQQVAAQQKVIGTIVKVIIYAFLFLMALIIIFPFYWMIISSLKTVEEYRSPSISTGRTTSRYSLTRTFFSASSSLTPFT